MIEDTDRIDRLLAESDAISGAFLTNAAVNDPASLEQRQSTFLGKLRRDPDAVPVQRPSPQEVHKAAQSLFAMLKMKTMGPQPKS